MLPVVAPDAPPPAEPVAPAPPPAPPPSHGHALHGGGRGAARADLVPCELRLLGLDRHPARAAPCVVTLPGWTINTVTDPEEGVVKFRVPRTASHCAVRWRHHDDEHQRDDVDIHAHHSEGAFWRLGNLAHTAESLEARVASYQFEMGHEVTHEERDVAAEVEGWHDGGGKPTGAASSGAVTEKASFAAGLSPIPLQVQKRRPTVAPGGAAHNPFIPITPPLYPPSPELMVELGLVNNPTHFPEIPLSVVEVKGRAARAYFGSNNDGDVCFSASTCKTIALSTACLLRLSLNRYAAVRGLSVQPHMLLAEASAAFRAAIVAEARKHPALKAAHQGYLRPRLHAAFRVIPHKAGSSGPAAHEIVFTKRMADHLQKMITRSNNESSAVVIRNVGYGYIHGALVHAQLFDRGSNAGLWLAADFSPTKDAKKYPAFRIPAVNDRNTAQGATSKAFVRLMDMAIMGFFPDQNLQSDLLESTRTSTPHPQTSWFMRGGSAHRTKLGFFDDRGKIGDEKVAASRGGHKVFSEILEISHMASGRRFILSYQNAKFSQIEPLSRFVLNGLSSYIAATP